MASRRMRIKAMANIPSINRGRSAVGGGDTEKSIVPRSPGSPYMFDGPHSPSPWSPSPAILGIPSNEELMPKSPRSDSRVLKNDGRLSPVKPISLSPGRRRMPSESGYELHEINFAALSPPKPVRRLSGQRPEPSTSPVKSLNITSPSRPGPSISPFKTIVMMSAPTGPGIERHSPVTLPPPKNQTPLPAPLSPKSPLHSPYSPNYYNRKSPSSHLRPKSPVGFNNYNRPMSRPNSPLKSPSRTSFFSPPSTPGSSISSHEHFASSDQPRRAGSPAVHIGNGNYGTVSLHAEKDVGNMASSETLRQRLQKGTSLNTSKYSTTRKEFFIKYTDKKPDLSELKILHYTFWNPPNDRKGRKTSVVDNDDEDLFIGSSDYDNPFAGLPDEAFNSRNIGGNDNNKIPQEKASDTNNKKDLTLAVGPRVKVGPNGELIIDEQSLVVETSEAQRAKKHLEEIETVSGAGYEVGSSGFYRHKRNPRRGGDWTPKETVKFYRALSSCGTDFSMMAHLFPRRSRAELKSKFKREDRRNPAQISLALSSQTFDPMDKMTSSEEEEVEDFCIPPPKKRRRNAVPYKRKDSKKLAEIRSGLESDISLSTVPTCIGPKPNSNSKSELHPPDFLTTKAVAPKPKKPRRKPKLGNPESLHRLVEDARRPDSCTKEVEVTVEEFLTNNPINEFIIPDTPERTLIANITKSKSSVDYAGAEWTPLPQPEYGKNTKLKFPKGRPRRVFDKNVKRLEKDVPSSPCSTTKVKNSVEITRARKPKVKKNKQAGSSSLAESERANNIPETIPNSELVQPEILRFDPSDPLGFNVIPSISSNVETNDAEIVLDAPNCGTIRHQVFDIQSLSQSTPISQSLSPNQHVVSQSSGTSDINLAEPVNDENVRVNKRSLRVKPTPRVPRYRVPGPGGKANITSSSVVDEIEIEITCL